MKAKTSRPSGPVPPPGTDTATLTEKGWWVEAPRREKLIKLGARVVSHGRYVPDGRGRGASRSVPASPGRHRRAAHRRRSDVERRRSWPRRLSARELLQTRLTEPDFRSDSNHLPIGPAAGVTPALPPLQNASEGGYGAFQTARSAGHPGNVRLRPPSANRVGVGHRLLATLT